jgi:predicted metal-dependent peptidase
MGFRQGRHIHLKIKIMKAKEKIVKAKVQLILNQPFFATLAIRLKYSPDPTIDTACTNGNQVEYNPTYIDKLSLDEVTGVLAHEVMHTALLHHIRRNNREIKMWNKAADYAINPMLLSSGFSLPENYLISNEYDNKTAEQIYNLLPPPPPPSKDCQNPGDSPGNGHDTKGGNEGGTGDFKDPPADRNIQEIEAEMKQALAQALMVAKQQGKLTENMQRLINEILHPRINWREVLTRFLTEITKNDYTWKKPSPRYLYRGLYLPALETDEPGTVILIVDTSISIDQEMMNQFAGEVQEIVNTFNTSLKVIYVDTKVQEVQDVERDEPVRLHPKGGGGTDFRPGFKYIEENDLQPKAVVYLTDGECDSFPTPPDYEVLWAQFGVTDFKPPFGEAVQVI